MEFQLIFVSLPWLRSFKLDPYTFFIYSYFDEASYRIIIYFKPSMHSLLFKMVLFGKVEMVLRKGNIKSF